MNMIYVNIYYNDYRRHHHPIILLLPLRLPIVAYDNPLGKRISTTKVRKVVAAIIRAIVIVIILHLLVLHPRIMPNMPFNNCIGRIIKRPNYMLKWPPYHRTTPPKLVTSIISIQMHPLVTWRRIQTQ